MLVNADRRERFFRLRQHPLVKITRTSPRTEEVGVTTTRETVLTFSAPLGLATRISDAHFFAALGGERLLCIPTLAEDRSSVTLSYPGKLPARARILVSVDGAGVFDESGNELDADGDGRPGGLWTMTFDTSGTVPVPNTAIEGRVYDAQPGPDGLDQPLPGVLVAVLGSDPLLTAVTDELGFFRLSPAPAGLFCVQVDGRGSPKGNWPFGDYYPVITRTWHAVAGHTNNPTDSIGQVFLPRIQGSDRVEVRPDAETRVTFSASFLATNPAWRGVQLVIPPKALPPDARGGGGVAVGIAPVAPDRLPTELPPGLDFPLVIVAQLSSDLSFTRPVPLQYPNPPDPRTGRRLDPGAKTALWGLSDASGRWELLGTLTVSADGERLVTDPGVGVRRSGWFGVSPASPGEGPLFFGVPNCSPFGGFDCDRDGCPESEFSCADPCASEQQGVALLMQSVLFEGSLADSLTGVGQGCQPGQLAEPLQWLRDCLDSDGAMPAACLEVLLDAASGSISQCLDNYRENRSDQPDLRALLNQALAWQRCGLSSGTPSMTSELQRLTPSLNLQERISEAIRQFRAALFAAPVWLDLSPEDERACISLRELIQSRLSVESEGGVRITESERLEILQAPRPARASSNDVQILMDRLASFRDGTFATVSGLRGSLAQATSRVVAGLTAVAAAGWQGPADGILQCVQAVTDQLQFSTEPADFPRRPLYYYLRDLMDGSVYRGRLDESGHVQGLMLAPDRPYVIGYLDPRGFRVAAGLFRSSGVGQVTRLPVLGLSRPVAGMADSDGDGIADLFERWIGCNPLAADSDLDGVGDGTELRQSANPLDGAAEQMGQIAATGGTGSFHLATLNDFLISANASSVSLWDIHNPLSPVLRGRYEGLGEEVAASGKWVVASAGAELGVIQLAGSEASQGERFNIAVNGGTIEHLAVAGRHAFVSASTPMQLRILDLAARTEVGVYPLARVADALATGGGRLYVYNRAEPGSSNNRIEVLQIHRDGSLQLLGAINFTGNFDHLHAHTSLVIGSDTAYLAGQRSLGLIRIQDPANMEAFRHQIALNLNLESVVPDGGGRLVALGKNGQSASAVTSFEVQDVFVGAATNRLFSEAWVDQDLVLHRGFAFVAGATNGVKVMRYRETDGSTNAPGIQLLAALSSTNSQPSGEWFRLAALARDDGVVQAVDFYLDGVPTAVDGSFPFECYLQAPQRTPDKTQFTLRARATDTAGNETWTDEVIIPLDPDLTIPGVFGVFPRDGQSFPLGEPLELTVWFDEDMSAESLDPFDFELIGSGPDGVLGTADDRVIPGGALQYRPDLRAVIFQPDGLLAPGRYRARLSRQILDLSGNPLPADTLWSFEIRAPLLWKNPLAGTWARAENWLPARAPEPLEIVVVGWPAAEFAVTLDSYGLPISIQSLLTEQRLIFGGDPARRLTVTLGGTAEFQRGLSLLSDLHLAGGRSLVQGGLEIGPTRNFEMEAHQLTLRSDRSLINDANLQLFGASSLSNLAGSTLELRSTRRLGGFGAGFITVGGQASDRLLFNAGTLRKSGPGEFNIQGVRTLDRGRLAVQEGTLTFDEALTSEGVTYVASGAVVALRQGLRTSLFRRPGHIEGEGTLVFGGRTVVEQLYDFAGTTAIEGVVRFAGGVRSGGRWDLGGRTEFAGSSLVITGEVVLHGVAEFNQAAEAELTQLTVVSGVIQGRGRVSLSGPLRLVDAPLELAGSARLRLAGPVLLQSGLVAADLSAVEFASASGISWEAGDLQLGVGGSRILAGVLFEARSPGKLEAGNLLNEGVLRFSGTQASHLAILPQTSCTNIGVVEILGRPLLIDGAYQQAGGATRILSSFVKVTGSYMQSAGTTSLSEAALGVHQGLLAFLGGRLVGRGTIAADQVLVSGSAELSPGDPLGRLSVSDRLNEETLGKGNLSMGSLSHTLIEVGGGTPGLDCDEIQVAGVALLGGVLEVRLVNGYVPTPGTEIPFLSAKALVGTFTRVVGLEPQPGFGFELIRRPDGLSLRAVARP